MPGTQQARQSENSRFPHIFVLFRLSMDWIMFTCTQRALCFTESANLYANLMQVNPLRHTQEYCLAKYLWVHPGPVKLTDTSNHHRVPDLKEPAGSKWRVCRHMSRQNVQVPQNGYL